MPSFQLAFIVGALWGITNPLIKQGNHQADQKKQQHPNLSRLICLLTTPAFLLPQALNLCGSVLFTALLASEDLTVAVPIANATCLGFNAVVDVFLGHSYRLTLLLPGLAALVTGVSLCSYKP